MESLSTCLSEQTIRQIGWVLVHFLWQGCTVGAVLWAVLKILTRASSNTRYFAACAGMALMMMAPVVTFTVLNEPEPITPAPQVFVEKTFAAAETYQETTVAAAETISTEIQQIPLGDILSEKLEAALPWCVIGWAAGVAALSLWYLGGWCQLQKLRLIGTRPASERIAAQTADLARRLGISRAVRVSESMLVQVPTMIGWLKPVILLPATALTGLDEMQLRAMIAHELAHIKRHDYLVNIIQTAFEILGFYHPAVWWMSKQVRIERENCCDDMAAELVQDRTAYAKALFSMEEIRIQQLALALHASGGSLIDRIGRLVGKHETPRSKSGWVPTAITFGLLIALISGIAFTAQSTNIEAGERILHFPADRSIGMVKIKDSDQIRQVMSFEFWVAAGDWWNGDWEYLADARGDVKIPAGKLAALYVNKSGWEDLSPLSALRPDDLYMLSFNTSDVQRPRDKCMPHLAHLTGLKVLNLWFTDIGTEGMSHITELQELEYLRLPDRMTNRGLAYAAELKNLKGLYFQKNTVTDAGLSLLKNMQSLEELMLGGERISDEGLAHLADLKRLTYLWISGNISDAGLAHLRKVESLKILNLTRLAITDKGLAHLGSLPHLENLCLYGTNVTDAGLVHLKKLPLKKLDLGGTQVTAAGFASLADMPSLEYLDLPREIATDEGLRHLGRLTKLKYLRLPTVHYVNPAMDKRLYTDAGLAHLTNLQSLESLFIGGLGVTDAGMEHVARLTNLKQLHLFGCPITNSGLARLTSLKKLTGLDLYESKVTIGGLKQLNSLVNLENLDVHSAARDGQPLDISGLKKLVMLTICTPLQSNEKILDEDLACLANLRNLKWIQIASLPSNPRGLTDRGTAHLKALTNMDRLTIGGPELTDQSLANLTNMKKLDMLNIYGGQFTDKGLEHLEKLKSLQFLRLPGEHRFTPDGLKRLRSRLPNLLLLETDQQRSRSMGGGARAQTTAVNSNDPNGQPLISAAAFSASESNPQQSAGEARQYAVNRTVAEFPPTENFSTPESAYAAINRVMASGSREGWIRVSTKASAERIAQSMQQDQPVPAEWAKVVLNARILEVRIQGDRAMVIAEFPQELSSQKIVGPIDARSLKLEDGKWLNNGEDRFDTAEEAAEKFGALVERESETERAYRTALDQPSKFKQMAEELFRNLRRADYEDILSYYDEQTGKWKRDGWKRLDLDYMVQTDWPSFAVWVCRTFKDNPIVAVELGNAILSAKEFDGQGAPAVPYKLTLQDGSVLQGELYFYYRASSDTWQPAEGIDWHLQENPVKESRQKTVMGEWPTGTCSISGKVVAANTDQPLADARVHLFYDDTFASILVDSATDGTFEFQNIPSGKYHLQTSRVRGFQDAVYPENNSDDFPQFTLTEGEHRTNIILKPKPAYSIAGTIYDENNEPLKDSGTMRVVAWAKSDKEAGGLYWFNVTSQARIASDGTYVLDGLDGSPVYVMAKDNVYEYRDSFYPPCYYPGTLARDEAVKITFDTESSAKGIDIHLTKQGAFTLEGVVTDETTGKPIVNSLVIVHRRDMLFDYIVSYTDRDGKYRIDSLTAGDFLVHVDAKPWGYVRTRKPMAITTEKTTYLDFTLRPAAKISGRIVDTDGDPVQVSSRAYGLAYRNGYDETNSWGGPANRFSHDDGRPGGHKLSGGQGDYEEEYMVFFTPDTFVIEGMMPGETMLRFDPKSQNTIVKAIMHNGIDIKNTGLETEPGQEIRDVKVVLENSNTTSKSQSNLEITDLVLEPVAQGKNALYATVKNDSDQEQVFAIHIYTRSPDYGPEGVGWGRQFFETLKANETRRLRFVYNIQGPVNEKTYVRVKYYNPSSQAEYDYEKPFAGQTYHSGDLEKQMATTETTPVSSEIAQQSETAFKQFQRHIMDGEYELAWSLLTRDHQKVQYHSNGLEAFKKQMEPVHPLDSGFLWEKNDFLKLEPRGVFAEHGKIRLQATSDGQTWTIDFVQENNGWKIDWIAGHKPAVIEMHANEASENILDQTGERGREAEKLNEIGVQFLAWAIERNDRFPQSLEDIQWHDPALKTWALTHMEYVGTNERADVSDAAQKVIAWDKVLPETQNGTNVLFADHHVEFVSLETLNSLLQKQSGGTLGGLGGGMGGFGSTPISDPQDQIIFPKNWNEIAQAQGEDPNRLSANFKPINGMQIVVYDITDFLAGSFDQDYLPGQAGVNRAAERLIKEIEAIVPESWRSNGGQGQVNVHGTTKLMIRQTPEVHEKIADHLAQRRIQVAIEARFILADDSFEQSMGFEEDAKEKGRVTEGLANSDEIKAAMQTKPLAERDLPAVSSKPSAESGLYSFDSKTERLIIRAVQSFKNAKTLTAPKALVMNSESASMRVGNTHSFVDAANETREIDQGVVLDLLPVVQDDNKTILLKTHIQVTNILDERAQVIGGKEYSIPWVQVTTIPFQAQVESGGTILVRGPEVGVKNEQTGELEKQRLFVLLKPTALAAPEDK